MCRDCKVSALDGLLQLHVLHQEWHKTSWKAAVSTHVTNGYATRDVLHVQSYLPANDTYSVLYCHVYVF